MENSRVEITRLLEAWREGDNNALDALTPLSQQRAAAAGPSLPAPGTAQRGSADHRAGQRSLPQSWWIAAASAGRIGRTFFAMSAQLMRRTLVDLAGSRRYAKRRGEAIRVTFDEALEAQAVQMPDWIALDDVTRNITIRVHHRPSFQGAVFLEQAAIPEV